MFITRHGNIETAIYIPLVIHTIQGLVQDQTRYYYSEKRITSHGRHPKLLYIIFLHLRSAIHTKSYPTVTQDCGEYNYYSTGETTTSSDGSVVILIKVATKAWKWNMIIWEQTVLRSLRTIGARMWPWSHRRWQTGTTRRGDASYITPLHTIGQSIPHRVQVPQVHVSCLQRRCKPSQSGPVMSKRVEKLHTQGPIFAVLILKHLGSGAE